MENTNKVINEELVTTLKQLTEALEQINSTKEEKKIVYTPMEAMKILGVGRNTMYEVLLKDKTFPSFRIGAKILISKSKLEVWIENQCE